MATAMQKRPLLLLHKCPECTTFALKPLPMLKSPYKDVNSVQQRFSRLRLNTAPPTIEENERVGLGSSLDDNSVFEEENELNRTTADGSSTSGVSSLDDSPVSGLDYPSPRSNDVPTKSIDDDFVANVVPCQLKKIRHRSVSECEGISAFPIKGILKRRTNIMRSLSECANENGMGETIECFESNAQFGYFDFGDDDESASEQQLDQQDDLLDQSLTSKKTVRFNDRVQQALFRPNSSILGNKKKLERKQQQPPPTTTKVKRKRTNSNSNKGVSWIVRTDLNEMIDEVHDDQKVVDQKQRVKRKVTDMVIDQDKKPSMVIGTRRYAGFMIGHEPIVVTDHQSIYRSTTDQQSIVVTDQHHQRHASGDSALGDDEGDDDVKEVYETATFVQSSNTRDSGIEEEA